MNILPPIAPHFLLSKVSDNWRLCQTDHFLNPLQTEYCTSLFSGLLTTSVARLQLVQNNAARLVLRKKKKDHVTPLLLHLHWLPVSDRIRYKIDSVCYKCIHKTAPTNLSDCLQLYTASRTLRSSSADTHFQGPSHQTHNRWPASCLIYRTLQLEFPVPVTSPDTNPLILQIQPDIPVPQVVCFCCVRIYLPFCMFNCNFMHLFSWLYCAFPSSTSMMCIFARLPFSPYCPVRLELSIVAGNRRIASIIIIIIKIVYYLPAARTKIQGKSTVRIFSRKKHPGQAK